MEIYPALKNDCLKVFSKLRNYLFNHYQSNIARGQISLKSVQDTKAVKNEFLRSLRSSLFENRQSLYTCD